MNENDVSPFGQELRSVELSGSGSSPFSPDIEPFIFRGKVHRNGLSQGR